MGHVKADDEWKRGMTKPSIDFVIAAQGFLHSCSGDKSGVLRYAMKRVLKRGSAFCLFIYWVWGD